MKSSCTSGARRSSRGRSPSPTPSTPTRMETPSSSWTLWAWTTRCWRISMTGTTPCGSTSWFGSASPPGRRKSSACATVWGELSPLPSEKSLPPSVSPEAMCPAALNVNDARKALRGKGLSGHWMFLVALRLL